MHSVQVSGVSVKCACDFIFFCLKHRPSPGLLCGAGTGVGWRRRVSGMGFQLIHDTPTLVSTFST